MIPAEHTRCCCHCDTPFHPDRSNPVVLFSIYREPPAGFSKWSKSLQSQTSHTCFFCFPSSLRNGEISQKPLSATADMHISFGSRAIFSKYRMNGLIENGWELIEWCWLRLAQKVLETQTTPFLVSCRYSLICLDFIAFICISLC